MKNEIKIEVHIIAPLEKIWKCWTEPEHITQWAFASNDWCAPRATNDLRVGGTFMTRMEAKDGSAGFDLNGVYTAVEEFKLIEYTMEGGRKVNIEFVKQGDGYNVIETFEPENENPLEMQKAGWQSILDNFKKYVS